MGPLPERGQLEELSLPRVLLELHRASFSGALVLKSGVADLDIHCRETVRKTSLGKCPVCRSKLKRVKNLTVYGGTVTLGYHCRTCGYWTGLKQRVPTKYVFTRT